MSIKEQLRGAAEEAGFTQQDMATWLEYDYSTVQKWFCSEVSPLPLKQKHVALRLKVLRTVIKHGLLPVPPAINQFERKGYVEGIRDRALKGIFSAGASN